MSDEQSLERYEPARRALGRTRPPVAALPETLEREPVSDLLSAWGAIRKRRWTLLSILLVLLAVVLVGTLKQKPVYRAKALLEIEQEDPNIVTVQELFQIETASDAYLETQYRILESESLARRVIDELRLDRVPEFIRRGFLSRWRGKPVRPTPQVFATPGAAAPDPVAHQSALDTFSRRLAVAPIKRSRLVEVSFESEDPQLAAQVVNSLASNYVAQNFERRWQATRKASEWLSEQLLDMKANLEKSEEQLQAYARENGLLFLESEGGDQESIVNERLLQLQEELTRAQTERFAKESFYRLTQTDDYSALPGIFENKLMQDLTLQLAELRRAHAQAATTFSADYPAVKQLQNQIEELERLLAEERARASARLANDYRAARERETLLQRAFAEQQQQADRVAERSVQYNILKREVETNKQLYEGLLQRLKVAGMSAGLKASHVRVVDPARPPDSPAKPNLLLNLLLAVVLGLGLGVGAVILQERFDNSLKTPEDVEHFLRLPVLALIPSLESLNGSRGLYGQRPASPPSLRREALPPTYRWPLVSENGEGSKLAEAFRSLRTSVLLSTPEQAPRLLLISSAQPGEGKTTVSLNLAISLAHLGERVLLIDADLRRPCVHKAFDLAGSRGLVSYLTGQQDWSGLIHTSSVAGLDILTCGPVPPNPTELLSSERLHTLLAQMLERYHFVLLDSPPLLNVADARILAALVEGVVLVVQGGSTPRELAQRAYLHAREVGGNVIGVALNNLDTRADDYYYARYYRYDYYSAPADEPPAK
ncbi:MAG: polysaccharide biosynthesis tyrosine autokinase [Acidobacteria bacterium]|nr:polysaccharide biosynthesis tyrosine autokinase [Acidobacteriota bacterium]